MWELLEFVLPAAYVATPMLVWSHLRIRQARPTVRLLVGLLFVSSTGLVTQAWGLTVGCMTLLVISLLSFVRFGSSSDESRIRGADFIPLFGVCAVVVEFCVIARFEVLVVLIWSGLAALPSLVAERSLHPMFWTPHVKWRRLIDRVAWTLFWSVVGWNLLCLFEFTQTGMRLDYDWTGNRQAAQGLLLPIISLALPSRRIVPLFITFCVLESLLSVRPCGVPDVWERTHLLVGLYGVALATDELCRYLERPTLDAADISPAGAL